MTEKFMSCPFCGGDRISLSHFDVKCSSCKASVPGEYEAWNRRSPDPAVNVDSLAQEIRRVDGNHSLGAGALAERIASWIELQRNDIPMHGYEAAAAIRLEFPRDPTVNVGAVVKALEIGKAYVEQWVKNDGGIDSCDIEFRADFEAISAALSAFTSDPVANSEVRVTKSLHDRCVEILEWKRTGVLPGTALRDFADDTFGEHHKLMIAESKTAQEAMTLVASLPVYDEEKSPAPSTDLEGGQP